jgi:O-antigen ligase
MIRCFKSLLGCSFLVFVFGILLFSNWSVLPGAPQWLQTTTREIQAACRDSGTQSMVVVCLVSYLVTFFILERRADRSWQLGDGRNESRPRAISYFLTSISSPDFWLLVFVALVLFRYAFDYANAAKSLQVVVLLTGIVVGKGIALWAAWSPRLKSKVQGPRSGEVGQGSPLPAAGGASVLASQLVGSLAPPAESGAHGVTRPTINKVSAPSSIFNPLSSSRQHAILGILILLLSVAALWHPERGMEFFYRGQPRWTGPWDNPNLFGVLMGVGTVLAVGLLIGRKRPTSNAQLPISKVHRFTSLVTRHAPLPLLLIAAGMCAYALLKSYSRGAWLGTACGLAFLLWRFFNHETHQIHESNQVALTPLPAGGHPVRGVGQAFQPAGAPDFPVRCSQQATGKSPAPADRNVRPTGTDHGEGSDAHGVMRSTSQFSCPSGISWLRKSWFPFSILLASILVLCFWQFRHTESPLVRRLFSVGNPNDFSWRNRVAAWEGAGRMMLDKPLLGFGWGKAEEIYSKQYRAERLEESAAIQMNDYLMIGISAGGPALLCLLVYAGLVLLRNAECGVRSGESMITAELQASDLRLSTPAVAASGAAVLLIGFWFDGGLFKLPTAVVFWVLVELARREALTTKHTEHTNTEREASVLAGRLVGSLAPPEGGGAHGVTRPTILLRWAAGIMVVVAFVLTAVHLITPQLAVSDRTLGIARKFIVPPGEKADFEYLATKPIWSEQPLKVLLQHADLANYNRALVNWRLSDEIYREFVLSPEIVPTPGLATTLSPFDGERDGVRREPSTLNSQPSTDLSWRRPLWEFFYPRIRKESSLAAAAEIVMRQLREQVKATHDAGAPAGILESWQRGAADEATFRMLAVAALRAVGIPSRLTGAEQVEFWNGAEWKVVEGVSPTF